MAYSHGSDADFRLDNSAGSLTDISAYTTDVSLARAADTAEVSTFGDNAKEYIAGLTDATFTASGIFDPTVDVVLDAAVGVQRSFQYGPQGTTGGNIKYTGECICTSYDPPATMGDAVKWSASFQVTGAITRGTY